ncbi:hypothetical protein Ciccas_014336 [Cichlidogyrus casuarinus]|uniref:Uncharacterized protein n=1 Tax=Cichlidogyrus casuarinus TaxID=1844966 RepID=A0ABD2PIF6_9PLAT
MPNKDLLCENILEEMLCLTKTQMRLYENTLCTVQRELSMMTETKQEQPMKAGQKNLDLKNHELVDKILNLIDQVARPYEEQEEKPMVSTTRNEIPGEMVKVRSDMSNDSKYDAKFEWLVNPEIAAKASEILAMIEDATKRNIELHAYVTVSDGTSNSDQKVELLISSNNNAGFFQHARRRKDCAYRPN